jgi:hypothetical protein
MHPYLLAVAGGAGWMLLWLKVAGLLSLRDAPTGSFKLVYLALALALGGILGLCGQALWSRLAAGAAGVDKDSLARDLRIAWGVAALPQVAGLVVLLPLDLAIAGRAAFATDPLGDSVSTAWAAFSIALSAALAAWNVYLLARGTRVSLQIGPIRSAVVTGGAVLILALVFLPFVAYPAVAS